MLKKILNHLTAAFSVVRPPVKQARASKGVIDPVTDLNAMIHDYNLFQSMMNSLMDLHHSCITSLVDDLPREVIRHRAHSVTSPLPTPAAQQHGGHAHA
jgi:hypothetical protein